MKLKGVCCSCMGLCVNAFEYIWGGIVRGRADRQIMVCSFQCRMYSNLIDLTGNSSDEGDISLECGVPVSPGCSAGMM